MATRRTSNSANFECSSWDREGTQTSQWLDDADFVSLCGLLKVSDAVRETAWETWQKVSSDGTSHRGVIKNEKVLGICIFLAAVEMDNITFTVTELLKSVQLNDIGNEFEALDDKSDNLKTDG